MTDVPYISAAEVERLLDYPSLVEALAAGFAADWTVPVRHHYSIPMQGEPEQTLLLMPAWEAGQAIGNEARPPSRPATGRAACRR